MTSKTPFKKGIHNCCPSCNSILVSIKEGSETWHCRSCGAEFVEPNKREILVLWDYDNGI